MNVPNIASSATKIVLLMIISGLLVITFLQIPASDLFKTIATLVVGFYFGQKQNPPIDTTTV